MKTYAFSFYLSFCSILIGCTKPTPLPENLVPTISSQAPDYFCTWNMQVYSCSNDTNENTRKAMNEANVFGTKDQEGWVKLYPSIRQDLLFVLDDSWDIPATQNTMRNEFLGTTILDTTRFPSFTGKPAVRLKKLVDRIKSYGWKGVGGWICAQEPSQLGSIDTVAYWTDRLNEAQKAGMDYWKVDWGRNEYNEKWRRQLTAIGHRIAPHLAIEHAFNFDFISFSDVFRTYDVENVIAQPQTICRVAKLLTHNKETNAKGIINCEDEPYIAAGLGCSFAIMRHPYVGAFPNGKQDCVFPPIGRDIKHRLTEVVRATHWHRIAQPFGIGTKDIHINTDSLTDYWVLHPNETWNTWSPNRKPGDTLRISAPDNISRGLPLAKFISRKTENRPFVLTSLYPNGAIAIATIGRGLGREYISTPAEIEVSIPNFDHPIGVFGVYQQLKLTSQKPFKKGKQTVLAQDLASEKAINITHMIKLQGNSLLLSGDLIQRLGTQCNTSEDKSDPGFVLRVF